MSRTHWITKGVEVEAATQLPCCFRFRLSTFGNRSILQKGFPYKIVWAEEAYLEKGLVKLGDIEYKWRDAEAWEADQFIKAYPEYS